MTTKKHITLSLAMIAALGAVALTAGPAAAERLENRTSTIGQLIELETARAETGSKAGSRQTAAVNDGSASDAGYLGSGFGQGTDWRRGPHGFDGGR